MKKFITWLGLLISCLSLGFVLIHPAAASPLEQTAEEGDAVFRQRCASCHTIGGGKLVGPDLEGVVEQRERPWLRQFISDPGALFAAEDPLALELLAEYNNLRMPNMGLSDKQVDAVILFLEQSSGLEPVISSAVSLPGGNALAGQKLFTGEMRLENGGTACAACHTVGGTGFLDGGSLGPDLTNVYSLYGETGLASSLNQITFPSMAGIFQDRPLTPQEQSDLIAFFQWSDAQGPAPRPNATGLYLSVGTVSALFLFGIMAFFWPRQRQSLSDQLRKSRK
jgi:mono/diheme cytochrome c family protein